MKSQGATTDVICFGNNEHATDMTIKSRRGIAMAVNMFQDRIYTNKPLAVVRETICNALDEHVKHAIPRNILVGLTNDGDSSWYFTVRDFAKGLNQDMMENIFGAFFESTKTDDNSLVGGFGIGAKAPFAYSNIWQAVSHFEGRRKLYICTKESIDGESRTRMRLISDEPTEESGIEVRVPVRDTDVSIFKNHIISFSKTCPIDIDFKTTDQSNKTVYTTLTSDIGHDEASLIRTGHVAYDIPVEDDSFVRMVVPKTEHEVMKSYHTRQKGNEELLVRIGYVLYPIGGDNGRQIIASFRNKILDTLPTSDAVDKIVHMVRSAIIDAPIGMLTVSPSRETIELDHTTEARLLTILKRSASYNINRINAFINAIKPENWEMYDKKYNLSTFTSFAPEKLDAILNNLTVSHAYFNEIQTRGNSYRGILQRNNNPKKNGFIKCRHGKTVTIANFHAEGGVNFIHDKGGICNKRCLSDKIGDIDGYTWRIVDDTQRKTIEENKWVSRFAKFEDLDDVIAAYRKTKNDPTFNIIPDKKAHKGDTIRVYNLGVENVVQNLTPFDPNRRYVRVPTGTHRDFIANLVRTAPAGTDFVLDARIPKKYAKLVKFIRLNDHIKEHFGAMRIDLVAYCVHEHHIVRSIYDYAQIRTDHDSACGISKEFSRFFKGWNPPKDRMENKLLQTGARLIGCSHSKWAIDSVVPFLKDVEKYAAVVNIENSLIEDDEGFKNNEHFAIMMHLFMEGRITLETLIIRYNDRIEEAVKEVFKKSGDETLNASRGRKILSDLMTEKFAQKNKSA